ncbi:MAG TPA: amidohydrolase family protein [Steroidobacteraceae bacterium]
MLVRNAMGVMTGFRDERARILDADIRVRDGRIAEIAPGLHPEPGEPVLDASGCVIYPGWVNTHDHLFQRLLKGVSAGINSGLGEWLARVLQPRVARFTPDLVRLAARLGFAELLLSGATTCADHHYLYQRGTSTETGDVLFEAAEELGVRFVLCRGGAIDVGTGPGLSTPQSLPPETFDGFAADIERLVAKFHDPRPDAMRRIVLAPTTPTYSLTPDALRRLAALARSFGIRMHSHLSETNDYVEFCAERYRRTPVEFVAEHDWLGPDVWYAHLVCVTGAEIGMLASSGTGLAHCPGSNCRLGSGVAPVPEMARRGVPVSIAVDGTASNESGSMLAEVHLAWLIHRAIQGPKATTVEDVVHWASAGGAAILGLDAVGALAPGMAADLVVYEVNHPRYFGIHDLLAAPVTCGEPARVRHSLVQGRIVVRDGAIPGLDLDRLRHEARSALARLA